MKDLTKSKFQTLQTIDSGLIVFVHSNTAEDLSKASKIANRFVSPEQNFTLFTSDPKFKDTPTDVRQRATPDSLTYSISDTTKIHKHFSGPVDQADVCIIQVNESQDLEEFQHLININRNPTRLFVDLDAMNQNLAELKKLQRPGTKLTVMVKARAYGTDAKIVSKSLIDYGVDYLAVATVQEGIELRRVNVSAPILVTLCSAWELSNAIKYNLTPIVNSPGLLESIFADQTIKKLNIHLEVNTGFNRAGLGPIDAKAAIKKIRSSEKIDLEGLMMHFSCADEPEKDYYNKKQLDAYTEIQNYTQELGIEPIYHISNTAATISNSDTHLDMVRIGIGMYGIHPAKEMAAMVTLKPVASLISRVNQIIDVPKGDSVGYGATFTSADGTRLAVIPSGYADGVTRSLSNATSVEINGHRCKSIGNISMDSMTVDISAFDDVAVGDNATILGPSLISETDYTEIADQLATIPYEVAVGVGSRPQRIFIE